MTRPMYRDLASSSQSQLNWLQTPVLILFSDTSITIRWTTVRLWVAVKVFAPQTFLSSLARWWWDCGGTKADWLTRARGWRLGNWRPCCCCRWPDCLPLWSRWTWPRPGTRTGGAAPWSWSWVRWCCGAAWQTRRLHQASRGWSAWGRPGKWWRSGRCLPDSAQRHGLLYSSQSLRGKKKKRKLTLEHCGSWVSWVAQIFGLLQGHKNAPLFAPLPVSI